METTLAHRYTPQAMTDIWTEPRRQQLERQLWLAILSAQADSPHYPATREDLDAYAATIDHPRIAPLARQIEQTTQHQTKAHIEAWNTTAGRQAIHHGLTSADIVETVNQRRIYDSLRLCDQYHGHLCRALADAAHTNATTRIATRTHNQPAQPGLFGRRIAGWAGQLLHATLAWPPIRPIRGATGTAIDLLALTNPAPPPERDGHPTPQQIHDTLDPIDRAIRQYHGQPAVRQWDAPWQNAPYQAETPLWAELRTIGQTCGQIATTLRLMNGHGQIAEPHPAGRVGSSAMPHKRNMTRAERVRGLNVILAGYLHMADLAGYDTWYEGDVTVSAARRIYLPGIFQTTAAIYHTTRWLLTELMVDTGTLEDETHRHRNELGSSRQLAELIHHGAGREDAHRQVAYGGAPRGSELPGWETGAALHQTGQVIREIRSTWTDAWAAAHPVDWETPI